MLPIVLAISISGCMRAKPLIVWRTEVTSPDGKWIAIADTVQNGGFGTASVETSVYLDTPTSRTPPARILGFTCNSAVPHAYILDNTANKGGTIDLKMSWESPSHLMVTYVGDPDIDLETVKYDAILVSVRRLSETADGRMK